MKKNNYFMLFSTCIPVKGANTSLIMDLDKGGYLEIPNLLCDILLKDLQKNDIKSIKKIFENKYNQGIDEYFEFLTINELGFFIDDTSNFRKPENVFYSPYKIISAVIALNKDSSFKLRSVFKQLEELSCQIIQLRIYDTIDFDLLVDELLFLKDSPFKIVEIYLKDDIANSDKKLLTFLNQFPNVLLIVHSSKEKRKINLSKESNKKIYFTTDIIDKNVKEIYNKKMFTISHNMYYEAKNYNTGLFRKLTIDVNGDIKNYLTHKKVFGNIKNEPIKNVLENKEYIKKQLITNDSIDKCKDCQFRYMCLSSSDIIKSNDFFIKVDTCNFDPYSNKWKDN